MAVSFNPNTFWLLCCEVKLAVGRLELNEGTESCQSADVLNNLENDNCVCGRGGKKSESGWTSKASSCLARHVLLCSLIIVK